MKTKAQQSQAVRKIIKDLRIAAKVSTGRIGTDIELERHTLPTCGYSNCGESETYPHSGVCYFCYNIQQEYRRTLVAQIDALLIASGSKCSPYTYYSDDYRDSTEHIAPTVNIHYV